MLYRTAVSAEMPADRHSAAISCRRLWMPAVF